MFQPNGLPKEIPCVFGIDFRITVKDEFRFEIKSKHGSYWLVLLWCFDNHIS